MHILESHDLRVHFSTPAGEVCAVDGVDFYLDPGEKLVFLGETGSGKTVLGTTIMGLLPGNVRFGGELRYKGQDLLQLTEKQMQQLRGRELAIIMQNPLTSLNPCLSIRDHIVDVLRRHRGMSRQEAREEAGRILVQAGIPAEFVDYFAHQLSGGLRQRAMIALGIACDSEILIADEPTKGLDVTLQLQVVKLLKQVTEGTQKSMFIITHDLGVAAALADRIAIMYCGRILEVGTAREIFEQPLHPYTKGLIAAHPCNGLHPIEGSSASLIDLPEGCVFAPRCPYATEACTARRPAEIAVSETHKVRCCHAARA